MIPRQGSLGRFACQAWRNLTSGAKTGGSAAVVGSQLEMPGWKQLKTACNTGLAYGDRCGGSQSSTSAAAASRCLPRHHLGGSRPLATATVGQAEHAACVSNVAAPTTRQLRVLAMHSALPMVGFGIMDQTIMIQAGDLIDTTLGAKLALPTLAAAACGQVFSDFAGVMFGGTVEAFASRLGLPLHGLTSEQLVMARTRKWSTLGAAIGVLVGCLIGMTQMLFMDLHREEQIQELEQIKVVVEEMLKDDAIKLHAERCVLYFVDHKERRVWTVVSEGGMGLAGERVYVDMSWDEGISGACVRSGKAYNIPNAYECDFFNPAYDKKSGGERFTKSVLALPVFVRGTEAIFAVLQFINKKEGDKIVEFNDEDVEVARQMAHYISMLRPALAPAVEKQQALHSTWIH